MRTLLVLSVLFAAGGCWLDEFEAATNQNQEAMDAYEQGGLVESYAEAPDDRTQAQEAVERYYAEHGQYPPTLQELVPKYLGQVPRQQDGTPLTYNPGTGTVSY